MQSALYCKFSDVNDFFKEYIKHKDGGEAKSSVSFNGDHILGVAVF